MKRTLLLGLNNFPSGTLPLSLLDSTKAAKDQVDVDLKTLCHLMYLDNHGLTVPNPNPCFLQYKDFVTHSSELEFASLGTHKEAKNAESMKLGKAFCRSFLYEHFGMVHFAHMDHILGKVPTAPFSHIRIARNPTGGDTPDYVCANGMKAVFLAEAKGRQTGKIDFGNPTFQKFRNQFANVSVTNISGAALRLKGYIVATRFRLSNESSKTRSKMYAEDPYSPGQIEPSTEEGQSLYQFVLDDHYASVFDKLALPTQAAALRLGFTIQQDAGVTVGMWRCLLPQFKNLLFVGGLYPADNSCCTTWEVLFQHPDWKGWNPNLLAKASTFFGLEKSIFVSMLGRTRQAGKALSENATQVDIGDAGLLPAAVSYLKDGTLLGLADFMRLENVVTL